MELLDGFVPVVVDFDVPAPVVVDFDVPAPAADSLDDTGPVVDGLDDTGPAVDGLDSMGPVADSLDHTGSAEDRPGCTKVDDAEEARALDDADDAVPGALPFTLGRGVGACL